MSINYSFEIYEFNNSLTPYGTMSSHSPDKEDIIIDDFREGTHFRTKPEDLTNNLTLDLSDKIITFIIDQSGSNTWNDNNNDRFTFIKRLIGKLDATYPNSIKTNLLTFNGEQVTSSIFATKASVSSNRGETNFNELLKQSFENSAYDLSGVRIVRKTTGFPVHAADGTIIFDSISESVLDSGLIEGQDYYYGIWTYNKNGNFNDGHFIKITPKTKNIPSGLNFANGETRILNGIERDEFTQIIYNFQEKEGNLIFDSSGNNRHGSINSQTILTNFWSGDSSTTTFNSDGLIKNPSGVRFDGTFDLIETSVDENLVLTSDNHLTVSFWIFRYSSSKTQWIAGTVSDSNPSQAGWAIGITNIGNISVIINEDIEFLNIQYYATNIPEKTWTMVTVTFDTNNITIYKNSEVIDADSVPSVDTSSFSKLHIGGKQSDSGFSWTGTDFFGCLAQFNVSNSTRSTEFIQNLYEQESPIFDQSSIDKTNNTIDNLQREVLLNWIIGSDLDFDGGLVKIVRKYNTLPSNDQDGILVAEVDASEGEFFFVDSYDFIHNGNYFYRFFTKNSLGNYCEPVDARVVSVKINKSKTQEETPVASVENLEVTTGNKKILLEWNNPEHELWAGTKIFVGKTTFPVVSYSPSNELIISNGTEITDTIKEFYIYRNEGSSCNGDFINLSNSQTYFFTVVSYDVYGRLGDPEYIEARPEFTSNNVFDPVDIYDLNYSILNKNSITLNWKLPTTKSPAINLFFGESALIFSKIKNLYGESLNNLNNIKLVFCTTFDTRPLVNIEKELEYSDGFDAKSNTKPCSNNVGYSFSSTCNSDDAINETVLTYSNTDDVIKGLLTHSRDRELLARRQKYSMLVYGQYNVLRNSESVFEFNTEPVTVNFYHPFRISSFNKSQSFVVVECENHIARSLDDICQCDNQNTNNSCKNKIFNGSYTNSSRPYVCRIEIQYKGMSLPDGVPIDVRLFKHEEGNLLRTRSTRTSIQEGSYPTTSVEIDELDSSGVATGRIIKKSFVDIPVPCPTQPDFVDLYVSLNYLGFFVDVVHEIRFISNVFIRINGNKPDSDGIDVAEQTASVWYVNPDNPSIKIPVENNTLVKWELIKKENGKDRPFYSTENNGIISGVYSKTSAGTAKNVFFGPVGNLEKHFINLVCKDEEGAIESAERCCLSEEYEIKASVIYNEQTGVDSVRFGYSCDDSAFTNKKFFMNLSNTQFVGIRKSDVHYWTWADGEHYIRFDIAQNPSIADIPGRDCFINCSENFNEQQFILPLGHVIEVVAPGDIIWNAVFQEDPYSDEITLTSYDLASYDVNTGFATAQIPIADLETPFYIKLNKFMGNDFAPKPQDCESGQQNGSGLGAEGTDILPCEWKGICDGITTCFPTKGKKWDNVQPLTGKTTLLFNNKPVTLQGGGDYESGIPPIYVGFQEPLNIEIIDARVNGERIDQIVTDGMSAISFVVDVTFAGKPVPDGTPIELSISGTSQSVLSLSGCIINNQYCAKSDTGIVYTRKINDYLINPDGDEKSLAFFTINPLQNVNIEAQIKAICRYDKLGTATRNVSGCIKIKNNINEQTQNTNPTFDNNQNNNEQESPASGELLVYDIIDEQIEYLPNSRVSRIGHFMSFGDGQTNDSIYIFGGWSIKGDNATNGITGTSEKFSIASGEWEYITNIPSPRAYGMSVKNNNTIYCIGGIELDVNNQLQISRKIESYNTITGSWNPSLSPMPETFGVGFGDAQLFGDYIYVTCGAKEIIDTKLSKYNDKILRYSIQGDEWDIINLVSSSEYERITPFGFLRNTGSSSSEYYYIFSGSKTKNPEQIENERTSLINSKLNILRANILSSVYYNNLSKEKQQSFLAEQENSIKENTFVSAFIYLNTGFKFLPGSEYLLNNDYYMDLSDSLDDEWFTIPYSRDNGQTIYSQNDDTVYFIGGSNQNKSTTLNNIETIDLTNNLYERKQGLDVGRSHFRSVIISNEIYISGGLKSGHKAGWLQLNSIATPDFVLAGGKQSSGLLFTLTDDSGNFVESTINLEILGKIKIPEIDDVVKEYLSNVAAVRALGGTNGVIPNAPQSGDSFDNQRFLDAINSTRNPNSDDFQINSAKQLAEKLLLLPVLYSNNKIEVSNGVGTSKLKARSEDPFDNLSRLSSFIKDVLENTPYDLNETNGNLTREELAALGDVLAIVTLPKISLNQKQTRDLYEIETNIAVNDDIYFGSSISQFDQEFQTAVENRIRELLTPPVSTDEPTENPTAQEAVSSTCLVLQSLGAAILPSNANQNQTPSNPFGTGDFHSSGQCLFCDNLLPSKPQTKNQISSAIVKYYNNIPWIPQIKSILKENTSTLSECSESIDEIEGIVPFGSSPIFDAISETSLIMSDESFNEIQKLIYILSDNEESLSVKTREESIEDVNSIDGDKKVPIIYTIFSTAKPVSISSLLEQTEVTDIGRITKDTGGQTLLLTDSTFISSVLNSSLTLLGLGNGIYTNIISFDDLTFITKIELDYDLYDNTDGIFRYKTSEDGYLYSDWSEKYKGEQSISVSLSAKKIMIEVQLLTGFTISENNDTTSTGVPKLKSITLETSQKTEDFIFMTAEDIIKNAQQVAAAFEGTVPESSKVEIGVATSDSSEWSDFYSVSRPVLGEFGKTFLLERDTDRTSVVSKEKLTTIDNILYTSNYKNWDPSAAISITQIDTSGSNANAEIPATSSYKLFPRTGQVYFDSKQPRYRTFLISIINPDKLRVCLKLINRVHNDNIIVEGAGYIYSTNDERPLLLNQLPPLAKNAMVSPKNPNADDTIYALYDFVDLNRDDESGSIIMWYKNGRKLPEIQNKTSWKNTDLLLSNQLLPNDKIYFSITPSDGQDYGKIVFSGSVKIIARSPTASDIRIIPIRNGNTNDRYDTSSILEVEYVFSSEDLGDNAIEEGTIITWYVNGQIFKQQLFSSTNQDPYIDPKSLTPDEIVNGQRAQILNNQIYVEVTPRTIITSGDKKTSSTITIQNSIPKATSVIIDPSNPTTRTTLRLNYTINDQDIFLGNQTNRSELKWFFSTNGRDYTENSELKNQDSVPPFYLRSGQYIYCEVLPYDGLDVGPKVKSNIVRVQSI